jgi:hypothetical protein
MPKLRKSTIKELKSEIRLWMVKIPAISALQLSQKLDRDYGLIRYLKNEIEEENAKNIDQESVVKEIAKFQLLVDGLMPHLWNILVGKKKKTVLEAGEIEIETTPSEKISAIRTIIENYKTLFDKKFDAGIFSKKLGEIEVKNKADILKVIIENLDETSRKQFVESAKRFLGARIKGGDIPR